MSEHQRQINGHADPHSDEEHKGEKPEEHTRVGLRERIDHFTWAWFTCSQSTGGVAIVLSSTPHQFAGLQTIGIIVFIFALVQLLGFTAIMATRFILNPRKLRTSLVTAPECFFFGSFWLTIATLIICMQVFASSRTGPWLITALRVLFWLYAATTIVSTTIQIAAVSAHKGLGPHGLNPAAFLMVYNAMLTGTIAAMISSSQPPVQRLPILVAGVTFQGFGWLLSLLLIGAFVVSLLRDGLPPPPQRPGLFMPVGTVGFTITALIGCAKSAPQGYAYFARYPIAADVLQILATWVGVFLWLLGFWLFATAVVCNLPAALRWPKTERGNKGWVAGRAPAMSFTMTWWAMIFPNVGWTLGTTMIGQELGSQGILWIASAQTIVLVIFWLLDLVLTVKAVIVGEIMWPGKDEDKEEDKEE